MRAQLCCVRLSLQHPGCKSTQVTALWYFITDERIKFLERPGGIGVVVRGETAPGIGAMWIALFTFAAAAAIGLSVAAVLMQQAGPRTLRG